MAAPKQYAWIAADLAPGRDREHPSSTEGLEPRRVQNVNSADFREGFRALWEEFGPKNEMEPETIIRQRLTRGASEAKHNFWTLYEMAVVRREGQIVAVRDVNAVVRRDESRAMAIVHLSHVLINPILRGSGLSGWLRALPLQTARRLIEAAGAPVDTPISLIAEMEHPDEKDPPRQTRLRSYAKAGFKAISPDLISYTQPDFRLPIDIDESCGAKPIPMRLIVRRVGREAEEVISRAEALELIESLYGMFCVDYRISDIGPLWGRVKRELSLGSEDVVLVDPLQC